MPDKPQKTAGERYGYGGQSIPGMKRKITLAYRRGGLNDNGLRELAAHCDKLLQEAKPKEVKHGIATLETR